MGNNAEVYSDVPRRRGETTYKYRQICEEKYSHKVELSNSINNRSPIGVGGWVR